jgi:hypothetical protein
MSDAELQAFYIELRLDAQAFAAFYGSLGTGRYLTPEQRLFLFVVLVEDYRHTPLSLRKIKEDHIFSLLALSNPQEAATVAPVVGKVKSCPSRPCPHIPIA